MGGTKQVKGALGDRELSAPVKRSQAAMEATDIPAVWAAARVPSAG